MNVILNTSRLVIREFMPEDAQQLFELNSNPEVLRCVLNPAPWTLKQAQDFIANYDLYERYGYGRWAVTEKDSEELIGWCGLKYRADYDHVDAGYRFAPQYWGKGYATEAASACVKYGFDELGLKRIAASYISGNNASLNVLKKIGMKDCGKVTRDGKDYPLLEIFSNSNNLLADAHIETERLLLRKMHAGDSRVMMALNSDPEVVKYTGDKPFSSLEETRNFFQERISEYERVGYGRWIVILKDTKEVLGWCGLKYLEDENTTDLGYRFFRKHWGKGYATEAAKASLEYGFNTLGLTRIIAKAMQLNKASLKVMEKCGMKFICEREYELHAGAEYEMLKKAVQH